METSVASPVLGGGIQNILPRMPLRFTFFDPSVTNLDRFMCYLGLIYFFAFGGYYLQFPGLYGSKGLVPLEDYYSQFPKSSSFSQVPNLMIFLITPGSKKAKALTVFGEKFYVGDVAEVFSLLGCFLSLVLYLFYVVRINMLSVGTELVSAVPELTTAVRGMASLTHRERNSWTGGPVEPGGEGGL